MPGLSVTFSCTVTEPEGDTPRAEAPKIVALVGSAGALRAFSRVLGDLPPDLAAPVLVLLHLHAGAASQLAPILGRATTLVVKQAEAGELPQAGHVYVAPPDAHLRVSADTRLELDAGPPVGVLRPAADMLLESIAHVYGRRALVVVLTGAGSDGADGVVAVKAAGGTVFAQDRESSEFFGMPGAAAATGVVDRVLPLAEVAAAVREFVRR
jgi:two-component system chemotaxis response regulator CheB